MSDLAVLGGPKAVTRPFPVWPVWDDTDRRLVNDALESGKWWMYAYGAAELGSGELDRNRSHVERFEEEFAAFHHVKHAVAVTSGSTALDICMRGIGLQPGDEVITTPYTFVATSTCILNANALPVYVDIDRDSYNIDPRKIEEAITERTRAIMPVHFAGELADMDAIWSIADKHGLKVIEDAAQAHGVCLDGDKYAGSFGDAGIFSFQASKCLSGGEGGCILTNSDDFAEKAWSLRHYGRSRQGLWYEHHQLGFNARMNELTAALLRAQLTKLEQQNAQRMANVNYLYERLNEIDGLEAIKLHPSAVKRSHYLVILRYDPKAWKGLPRARFVEALCAEGLPVTGGYSFLNFENPLFSNMDLSSPDSVYMMGRKAPIDYAAFAQSCPNAMRASREEAIWLLHQFFLGDKGEVDMIIDAILKIRDRCEELL